MAPLKDSPRARTWHYLPLYPQGLEEWTLERLYSELKLPYITRASFTEFDHIIMGWVSLIHILCISVSHGELILHTVSLLCQNLKLLP